MSQLNSETMQPFFRSEINWSTSERPGPRRPGGTAGSSFILPHRQGQPRAAALQERAVHPRQSVQGWGCEKEHLGLSKESLQG